MSEFVDNLALNLLGFEREFMPGAYTRPGGA